MQKNKLLSIILILAVIFTLTLFSFDEYESLNDNTISVNSVSETTKPLTDTPPKPKQDDNLIIPGPDSRFEVHFLDVGQADAALILSDNETMLIDGGNPGDSSLIAAYLKKNNITHLDYVICSHAHNDHVGGLPGALSVADVSNVYAPKTENDIKAYRSFKAKTNAHGLAIKNPVPGESVIFGSSKVTFLGPVNENSSDLNNTSIVLKISYGETSFLFTGDAEREEEQSILAQNYDLSATVLKVGHHGGNTSTTYPFLREIMPEYAIISVGKNGYGHPDENTLSRLRDAEVKVYRTDMHGDIIAISDGKTVVIKTKRTPNEK